MLIICDAKVCPYNNKGEGGLSCCENRVVKINSAGGCEFMRIAARQPEVLNWDISDDCREKNHWIEEEVVSEGSNEENRKIEKLK